MKKILLALVLGAAGFVGGIAYKNTSEDSIQAEKSKKNVRRLDLYYNLLIEWLAKKQSGFDYAEYLYKLGYKKIAVYGVGELGIRFIDELKNTSIQVVCAIDQNEACGYLNVKIINPGDPLDENVDLLVVTPIHVYAEIEKNVKDYVECPVVSLEDVIYENIR